MGASNRDEECCLVCGDADYEDDNLIGYCDSCALSVHSKCYGVSDFKGDFECLACRAFGKVNSTLVSCVLCGQRGGALKPLDCKLSEFYKPGDQLIDPTIDAILLEEAFQLFSDQPNAPW